LDFALAGTTGSRSAAVPLLARRRWSIFGGFDFLEVSTHEENPDEVGTRSQRQVDARERRVECSLPLGIEFKERDGGDIYVAAVEKGTDAWEQGVRPGVHVTMVSATFGAEMWTTRKVGMTQFLQVLNSRFGSSIALALEREDQSVLRNLRFATEAAHHRRRGEADEVARRNADMLHVFEREEASLQQKTSWNPFH
jgi:hypothetical protein